VTADFRERAVFRGKGHLYEDFEVGQKFVHHWGRTITEADTIAFSTLLLHFNPIYFNRDYAKAHGHPDIVVNPHLLFNTVLGMSVQDCSEAGGALSRCIRPRLRPSRLSRHHRGGKNRNR